MWVNSAVYSLPCRECPDSAQVSAEEFVPPPEEQEQCRVGALDSQLLCTIFKPMAKFLHTRIRVSDLDKSIAFYGLLGFECTRRTDRSPAGNQLAFLELKGNEHFLELCYSPDYKVNVPEDLMHTAVGYQNLIAKCAELEEEGVAIWPDGWRDKFSSGGNKMAFVTDPDGYEVELLERG